MTLGDLWLAVAAGDPAAIEAAYLHRAMREDGPHLVKGRDDIADRWAAALSPAAECRVLLDGDDFAIVAVDGAVLHHWVRREGSRLGFEVIAREDASPPPPEAAAVGERTIRTEAGEAQLIHRIDDADGLRWIESVWRPAAGAARRAFSAAIPND